MLPIQVFLSGVTAGSIYAIVALGFVLIYKGTKIIHFGLGEQVVLGAYLVLITQLYAGVPFLFNFGVPWEHNISFSQGASIRGGRLVLLSGQASLDDQDNVVGKGDMELQVRTSLEAVRKGLALAGATPADVIKLNVYTTVAWKRCAEGLRSPEQRPPTSLSSTCTKVCERKPRESVASCAHSEPCVADLTLASKALTATTNTSLVPLPARA